MYAIRSYYELEQMAVLAEQPLRPAGQGELEELLVVRITAYRKQPQAGRIGQVRQPLQHGVETLAQTVALLRADRHAGVLEYAQPLSYNFV